MPATKSTNVHILTGFSSNETQKEVEEKENTMKIVGIGIGVAVLVVVLLLIAAIILILKKRKRGKKIESDSKRNPERPPSEGMKKKTVKLEPDPLKEVEEESAKPREKQLRPEAIKPGNTNKKGEPEDDVFRKNVKSADNTKK